MMQHPAATGVPAVRSVLVLTKHHFLGDTIVAVPLLRGARTAFPGAQITLLTGAGAATVLEHCPFVDRLVRYAPRKERGLMPMLRLIKTLRPEGQRPDVCLIADRSYRSAIVARFVGGRIRAGFDTEGRGWLLTHPVPYRGDAREAECCLDILRAIAPEKEGVRVYDPTPELRITDAERARGREILRDSGATGTCLVGIQPGASYEGKQWHSEGFAAVADALVEQGAASGVVLIGSGEREIDIARSLRAALRPDTPVVDLTGKTSLRETMGVLSRLSLFVANDTGINHTAAALGIPTVGLFGPTSARKWGNVGERHVVLCAPEGDLARLEVAPVIDAARRLLSANRGIDSSTASSLPTPMVAAAAPGTNAA